MPVGVSLDSSNKKVVRFIDLCAGLGGFHRGLGMAGADLNVGGRSVEFQCVFASEIDPELRSIYVENFPGIRKTYARLFPRKADDRLQALFQKSGFGDAVTIRDDRGSVNRIHGDLAAFVDEDRGILRCWPGTDKPLIPEHELLAAGFPCQPFSKSGSQKGFADIRGTIFHLIAVILRVRAPKLVMLENVGNFDRHDGGNTWRRVRQVLAELGYEVSATRHKSSRGEGARGLLSPHHIGHPHHRERFFILARRRTARWPGSQNGRYPFPVRPRSKQDERKRSAEARTRLTGILRSGSQFSEESELESARLSPDRIVCIEHWSKLLGMLAAADASEGDRRWRDGMPSFPIWGYELDPWQWYPVGQNPAFWIADSKALSKERERTIEWATQEVLSRSGGGVDLMGYPPRGQRSFLSHRSLGTGEVEAWVETWPAYASLRDKWPPWKQRFVEQNREWALELWARLDPDTLRAWLDDLVVQVPAPSNQKLEWNCKGDELDLWKHIMQFRPSGLRVKRFGHVPALVAMTTTQVPVVPWIGGSGSGNGVRSRAKVRHLLRTEALQLQGFPADWRQPDSREAAFRAFGNAVHCDLVAEIAKRWLGDLGGQTQGSTAGDS